MSQAEANPDPAAVDRTLGPPAWQRRAEAAYLAALHETTLALLGHRDPVGLLEDIVARAAALAGTPHGYLYLAGAADNTLVGHVGIGHSREFVGYRLGQGEGLAGRVWQSGQPLAVDDYPTWAGRKAGLDHLPYRAIAAVPLTAGREVVGVLGLAHSEAGRRFDAAQLAALGQFAELASLALDNARLHWAAQEELDQRRLAERALRWSEERFRALADAAFEAVAIHEHGTIVEVNLAFARLFGCDPAAAIGRSVLDFAAPESHAVIRQQIVAQSEEAYEAIGLKADGTRFPVEVRGKALVSWGPTARVTAIRDLTARVRAEAALAASERRFRAIVDRAAMGIALADTEGRLLESNLALQHLLGYSAAELRGMRFAEFTHPDDVAPNLDLLGELLAGRRELYRMEKRYLHQAGHVVWGRLTVSPIPAADGRPQFVVGMVEDISERKRAEAALAEQERWLAETNAFLQQLIAASPAVIYRISLSDLSTTYVSPNVEQLLGYRPDEVLTVPSFWSDKIHPEDQERVRHGFDRALAEDGAQAELEYRFLHKDGRYRWRYSVVRPERDARGTPVSVLGVTLDVTARKQAEEELRRSARDYRHLFQRANDAILVLEPESEVVLDANDRASALYVLPRDELIGLSLRAISADPARGDRHRQSLLATGSLEGFETVHLRGDGAPLHLYINASLIEYQGRPAILSINRDIGAQKALEAQLAHRAFHDPLTDLPNRALFTDRLAQALAAGERHRERVAVLFVDLDRFKVINDSLGHDAGDQLLVTVAERLRACVRPGDTVSRLGGDEFTVLLVGLGNEGEATWVAERILDELRVPCVLDGQQVHITASVGVALGTGSDQSAAELLYRADVAMYLAKRRGKARYVVFEPGMADRASERLRLEGELRQALGRGELTLHYQPQFELATGRVVGLEALLRWRHPRRGLLPPAEFIPMAEEAGLIGQLGQWVLEEACRQAAWWQARYPHTPALTLGVNLSAGQVQEPGLVAEVAQVLRLTGVDPGCLELELTEGTVMDGTPPVLAVLHGLKSLGVRLAIDDFGMGHASFGYVKLFPVDTLKIDRSYVAGLGGDGEDAAIVRAMATMARTLGIRVTAEGVERAGQLLQLRALGCDVGQGYYFAEPLARQAVDELLKQAPR